VKKAAMILAAMSILWVAAQPEAQQQTIAGRPVVNKNLKIKKALLTQSGKQGLVFVSLSVGPIGAGCSRTNPMTMRNNSTLAIPANQYKLMYWSRAGASQPWEHYYGGSLAEEFAAGETRSFNLHFGVPLNAAEVRVTVNPEISASSPIICEASAPAPQLPVGQIAMTVQFSDTGWIVTIANNSGMSFCTDNMGAYKAAAASPDTWVPCGGTAPPAEIAASQQATVKLCPGTGWKTGFKFFKVVLYRGNDVYKEQVIDMGS
jgi:hypothetical protein